MEVTSDYSLKLKITSRTLHSSATDIRVLVGISHLSSSSYPCMFLSYPVKHDSAAVNEVRSFCSEGLQIHASGMVKCPDS